MSRSEHWLYLPWRCGKKSSRAAQGNMRISSARRTVYSRLSCNASKRRQQTLLRLPTVPSRVPRNARNPRNERKRKRRDKAAVGCPHAARVMRGLRAVRTSGIYPGHPRRPRNARNPRNERKRRPACGVRRTRPLRFLQRPCPLSCRDAGAAGRRRRGPSRVFRGTLTENCNIFLFWKEKTAIKCYFLQYIRIDKYEYRLYNGGAGVVTESVGGCLRYSLGTPCPRT